MGWVKDALQELNVGRSVEVRPLGGSMKGRIESGQKVTISPVSPDEVEVDDVVFIEWKTSFLLHLVKEISDSEFLIGNNLGKINGWIQKSAVKGIVTKIHEEHPSEP